MLRVQAFIVSHNAGVYKVEARAEGIAEPFIFDIPARSEGAAAMEAIRRVEAFDNVTASNEGAH